MELTPQEIEVLNGLGRKIAEANAKKGFTGGIQCPYCFNTFDNPADKDRRLLLMVGELIEAHEELRAGHGVNDIYYSDSEVGPSTKPEGYAVEVADAIIRAFDDVGKNDINIGDVIAEKLAFNAKRAHKHGGKAF